MRIGGGGSQDINLLQSDAAQFRNEDFVVDNALAFFGFGTEGPNAAAFPHVQLFNPNASGVVLLVDSLIVSTTTSQLVHISTHGTELPSSGGLWKNHFLGGVDGAGRIRRQASGSVLGTVIMEFDLLADSPLTHHFKYPVLLVEDRGFIAIGGVVNTDITVSFLGREV